MALGAKVVMERLATLFLERRRIDATGTYQAFGRRIACVGP